MGTFQRMGKVGLLVMAVFIFFGTSVYAQGIRIGKYIRNNPDGSQTLLHHTPQEVGQGRSKKMRHAASNQMLDLRIIVPSKDQAGLDNFIKGLYDRKSPNYHKFLTPAQFALLYGASATDSSMVLQYLKSQGLTVKSQSNSGLILRVTGTVSTVEPAFKVYINNYKRKDGKTVFAPDTDPTIPPQIAGKINAIVGMDNTIKFYPRYHVQNLQSAKPSVKPAASPAFLGHGGLLGPSDITTAYNLNSVASNGSGQILGLYELDGYSASDITAFEGNYSLPNVTLTNVYTDGANGVPGFDSPEDVLDIDLAIGTAPGLNSILIYEAPNSASGWIDQWNKIASDNIAKVISCSWGATEANLFPSYDHTVFSQLAAQGQTVFASSGDAGAYDNCDGGTLPPSCTVNGAPAPGVISVDDPASDPFITGVGISILTEGGGGVYVSETGSLYGGGGISAYWPIPVYQQGLTLAPGSLVSTTMRNVPDVSFTADPATTYGIFLSTGGFSAGWHGFWGSSAAAPIWAGFIARVNQGRLAAGEPVIGYLNPSLYQIAQGPNYTNDFHDITSGNNSFYPGKTGFDDATGLGSFNGANLYNDLIGLLAPNGLTALPGNTVALLNWASSVGAVSYNIKRAVVNGGPYVTVSAPGTVIGTSYLDSGLTNGTTYYYVISAVNGLGESPNSAQVSVVPIPVPASPTNLKATILAARVGKIIIKGGVSVTWVQAASPGILQNKIYRAVGASAFSLFATISPSTSYIDKNVAKGTTYKYEVTAVNALGESLPSNAGTVHY